MEGSTAQCGDKGAAMVAGGGKGIGESEVVARREATTRAGGARLGRVEAVVGGQV